MVNAEERGGGPGFLLALRGTGPLLGVSTWVPGERTPSSTLPSLGARADVLVAVLAQRELVLWVFKLPTLV